MALLAGFKVVQIGGGSAAAVCSRLMADVGAQVTCIDPDAGTMLLAYLNRGKAVAAKAAERHASLAAADLIVREGQPKDWAASGEKQPTASEKPAADKAAIKSLRDSATRVEESRSNVRKINQVSQEWFTSPKSRKTKAPPKVNKKTGALAP